MTGWDSHSEVVALFNHLRSEMLDTESVDVWNKQDHGDTKNESNKFSSIEEVGSFGNLNDIGDNDEMSEEDSDNVNELDEGREVAGCPVDQSQSSWEMFKTIESSSDNRISGR